MSPAAGVLTQAGHAELDAIRAGRAGLGSLCLALAPLGHTAPRGGHTVGSVIKKRRKRMAKKKHRKLLKRTRIQRRRAGK